MGRKGAIDVSIDEEKRLVRLAQEGNREVLNSLLIKYMPYIEKKALKYVQYGMDADDMIQECLMHLYDVIMKYRDVSKMSFRVYACHSIDRFLQNLVAEHHFMSSREFRKKISNNEEIMSKVVSLDEAISEIDKEELAHGNMDPVFDKVELGCINDYIDILVKRGEFTERQKKIIQLYYWKEMTYPEIGKIMGCSDSAIGDSIHKMLKKLENFINKELNGEQKDQEDLSFDWNRVWELLESVSISKRDREMLKLYYEDGLTHEEVGLKFGFPRTRVHTILKLLCERIDDSDVKMSLMELLGIQGMVKDGFKKKRVLRKKNKM